LGNFFIENFPDKFEQFENLSGLKIHTGKIALRYQNLLISNCGCLKIYFFISDRKALKKLFMRLESRLKHSSEEIPIKIEK
jgi:hypothetical protein